MFFVNLAEGSVMTLRGQPVDNRASSLLELAKAQKAPVEVSQYARINGKLVKETKLVPPSIAVRLLALPE